MAWYQLKANISWRVEGHVCVSKMSIGETANISNNVISAAASGINGVK